MCNTRSLGAENTWTGIIAVCGNFRSIQCTQSCGNTTDVISLLSRHTLVVNDWCIADIIENRSFHTEPCG